MTAGRPTRALWQSVGVVGIANENSAVGLLFLEMALQTQGRIALSQHSLIDRSVGRVAADATFTERFVFENERASLRGVALETGFVLTKKRDAAAFHGLRKTRPTAFDRVADVRIVAIRATHFSFQHWMVMRQFKFCAHFQMTLETGIGRLSRIDNGVRAAAALNVQASRSVAALTAHLLCVIPLSF